MTTIRILAAFAAVLLAAPAATAAPGSINYQGRLTDASGAPLPGPKVMNLRIYNATTSGTLLYSETLGTVTADANGVYSFQFGAAGTSDVLVTETLATTDGSAATYQKALSRTPVLPGTVSVADGTFSWNETTGNPGAPATATATVTAGFVIGATVTSGGSGYTVAPTVTITGNGTGATATATVTSGSVSTINIVSAGSGYTNGATITIAPPPAPFLVTYSNNTVSVTYDPAPPAGRAITATYRYSATGISGALAAGNEQWLELTVDGVTQTPRQKILAVPFAMRAETAAQAETLAVQRVVWRPESLMGVNSTVTFPMHGNGNGEVVIPIRFSAISNLDVDYTISWSAIDNYKSTVAIQIVRCRAGTEELLYSHSKTSSSTVQGRFTESIPLNVNIDPEWVYKLKLSLARDWVNLGPAIYDIKLTANQ